MTSASLICKVLVPFSIFSTQVASQAAFADALGLPSLVASPIDAIFVPLGFDDNDNVEVVLHGHFTSNCSKVGPLSATVDEATKTILVSAKAWSYTSDRCLDQEMYTSFVQIVSVGVVEKGDYTVKLVELNSVAAKPAIIG